MTDADRDGIVFHQADRLWRHPAEVGRASAQANLARRRRNRSSWYSGVIGFVGGCALVGLAWILQPNTAGPTVQSVTHVVESPITMPDGPFGFDDAWESSVAQPNRNAVVQLELGTATDIEYASALLLSTDGHLATSSQALAGVNSVSAIVGGVRVPAQVVASDRVSGVAVLKINSPDLPPPLFGTAADIRSGDRLVALRGADSESQSIRVNSVSLLERDFAGTVLPGEMLSGLLRLSSNLEDGWSGAALLNDDGGVVGLLAQMQDNSYSAIPSELVRMAATQLIADGVVETRAWLGVDGISDASEDLVVERGLFGGVIVSKVWDESPAAQAGLMAGDVIVRIWQSNIINRGDLLLTMRLLDPGDIVEIEYSRGSASVIANDLGAPQQFENRVTTVSLGARAA